MSTAALITQLSILTHDPVGPTPSLHRLYVSCHCRPLLSSPGQGAPTQKAQSVIKTKGHQRPAGARELRLCPAGDDPTSDVSYQLQPLWRCIETEIKGERDLRWLALHSRSGDISFVLPPTDPAPSSAVGWDREFGDNGGPLSQMGVGKIVSVVSTIKMDRPQPCLMWPMTSLNSRLS